MENKHLLKNKKSSFSSLQHSTAKDSETGHMNIQNAAQALNGGKKMVASAPLSCQCYASHSQWEHVETNRGSQRGKLRTQMLSITSIQKPEMTTTHSKLTCE